MRITIATGPTFPVPPLLGGAIARIWQGVAEELARRGHEVCIFARTYPGQPNQEVICNVRYIRWGGFAQSLRIWKDLVNDLKYAASAVWRLPQADILVTNDFWLPVFAGWMRDCAGRIVINAARFPKGQYRLYGRAARIAAASSAIRNAIVKQCPYLDERTRVFPNPVDLKILEPRLPQRTHDDSATLLYVGRLHPEKGVQLLIQAFSRLHHKYPNWRLRLVGPVQIEHGGGGPDYERQLAQHSRGLPVEFLGPEFDPHKLALLYQSADLFCYPSLAEKGEAFGVAPLEAMACGIAPVVSGLECFRDFVVPHENGWAFNHRVDDPAAALAATLDEAMNDPATTAAAGRRAYETAQRFSYEKIAELYLADFNELLGAANQLQ